MSESHPTTPVEYRDIAEFPGYQIGSDGLPRCCLGRGTLRGKPGPWRVMKPIRVESGYMHVALRRDRKYYHRLIHRVVLEAFVGPCPPGMECRHLNGNKADNRLENLAWGTKQENMEDQRRHGTLVQGSTVGTSKLTEEKVKRIKELLATGRYSQDEIAAMFDVVQTTISRIDLGQRWKHV